MILIKAEGNLNLKYLNSYGISHKIQFQKFKCDLVFKKRIKPFSRLMLTCFFYWHILETSDKKFKN